MIQQNNTGMSCSSNCTDVPVLVIFAPTATGKTALAETLFSEDSNYPLAGKAEIISADSMQVYKGMDIGTAKPDSKFLKKLPHHLINLCNPNVQFGAGEFVRQSDIACKDIWGRGKLPVVLGGTAFYIRNFLFGLPPTPVANEKIRLDVEHRMNTQGAKALYAELSILDPVSATQIHINDEYRIKRALEVCYTSGKPRSEFAVPEKYREGFTFFPISLERPREVLYERINKRVEIMFEMGLEKEFHNLIKAGYKEEDPGMQAIGYREFFKGTNLEEIKTMIKTDTRHYAKRQETFIKPLSCMNHFPADSIQEIGEKILCFFQSNNANT